jgi:hypothetical protein
MLSVSQNFTRHWAPVAAVVTLTGLMAVAYFASDLVEFFANAWASATPDYNPTPIVRAP